MLKLAYRLASDTSGAIRAGSSPVPCTISSVHNGFELWTLDFFVISSFFVMYGAGFKPALLFYADLVIYSTATPFRVSAL